MKKISFLILSFALISLTSCDVNKFLEDVATAMEESSQQQTPSGNTGGTTNPSTETRTKTRTTERSQTVEDNIFSQLNLTNTQVQQYNSINTKYENKITELENSGVDRIKMARELKTLRTAQEEELVGILTTAQKLKYDELMAKEKGQ